MRSIDHTLKHEIPVRTSESADQGVNRKFSIGAQHIRRRLHPPTQ
jgi:hypothetical protein